MNFRKLLYVFFLWVGGLAAAPEQGPLKIDDVQKVMKQILQQHLGQKEVSTAILKHSLINFVEQFDPDRVYLLDDEVRPYIKPTDYEVNEILEQYKNNDLSIFRKMNTLFQNAIERSRSFRQQQEGYVYPLVQASLLSLPKELEWPIPGYAKSLSQLQDRIRTSMIHFFREQIAKYGKDLAKDNGKKLVDLYENATKHAEEQYMPTDENSRPIPLATQNSFFALHVLKALASGLDVHTKVYNPDEAFELKIKLEKEFEGIGVELIRKDDKIVIANLVQNSPAAKSGQVKVNDHLLAINGTPISNETVENVVNMLHELTTPEVNLKLERTESEPFPSQRIVNVTLKRELIPVNEGRVETASVKYDNGIIGILTLHSFYKGADDISSYEDLRKAILQLQKQGNLRGLILDLRDNTGGFLTQAVKVVGLFITSGVAVISKYSNGEEHFYRDIDNKEAYKGPLVILTSRETASAAEIVTQALQDYGIALVVGDEQTYGKGTIQSQTVTESGSPSFFKVTVGKYYTVSGKSPQLQGVKADIIVPSQLDYEAVGEEFLNNTTPEKVDTIPSAYDDKLQDVSAAQRPWYLQYYTPHLQHKVDTWKRMVPVLKRDSEQRIANNKVYQEWIKHSKGLPARNVETVAYLFPDVPPKTPVEKDLQMSEAINIVKDMIRQENQSTY